MIPRLSESSLPPDQRRMRLVLGDVLPAPLCPICQGEMYPAHSTRDGEVILYTWNCWKDIAPGDAEWHEVHINRKPAPK